MPIGRFGRPWPIVSPFMTRKEPLSELRTPSSTGASKDAASPPAWAEAGPLIAPDETGTGTDGAKRGQGVELLHVSSLPRFDVRPRLLGPKVIRPSSEATGPSLQPDITLCPTQRVMHPPDWQERPLTTSAKHGIWRLAVLRVRGPAQARPSHQGAPTSSTGRGLKFLRFYRAGLCSAIARGHAGELRRDPSNESSRGPGCDADDEDDCRLTAW